MEGHYTKNSCSSVQTGSWPSTYIFYSVFQKRYFDESFRFLVVLSFSFVCHAIYVDINDFEAIWNNVEYKDTTNKRKRLNDQKFSKKFFKYRFWNTK